MREGEFYQDTLEKGLCSELAPLLSMAEVYVHRVSTGKVAAITEELITREVLVAWRDWPLDECCYLYLDANYDKVR